jgi:P27 family predicted phage terminase small subunit
MGVLAQSDVEIVARYSTTLDMLHQAQEQLKDEVEPVREIVDDKTGQMKFTRDCAAFDLFQKCHAMLRQMEAVLGLSPADRTKLGIARTEQQKVGGDPFADLLAS